MIGEWRAAGKRDACDVVVAAAARKYTDPHAHAHAHAQNLLRPHASRREGRNRTYLQMACAASQP